MRSKLFEPLGDVGGEEVGGRGDEAGGAVRTLLLGDLMAIDGEGTFAEASTLEHIFGEENEGGDAGGGANLEFEGDLAVGVFDGGDAELAGESAVAVGFGDEAHFGHDVVDFDGHALGFAFFLDEEGFFDAVGGEDAPFDEDFADGLVANVLVFEVGG